MKRVLILGSTGSIGINTLNVIREFPELFSVEGLSVNSGIDILEQQINEFKPRVVCVCEEKFAVELKKRIGNKCEVLSGKSGLVKIAADYDYDILVGAMVGFSGLEPTLEAIKKGKRIALANKETLVVAGEIVTKLCKEFGSEIIPVDSEHSAIFQCLVGEKISEVSKLILTASGGPFLTRAKEEFKKVTLEEALNHPNWKMGNKISIDSATMMNKGLEVIEAHWLFNLSKEQIEVVIHPQSIIHSMVEFVDGSIKAQLSLPDMRLPIQYALTFPERLKAEFVKTNFAAVKNMTFFEPDFDKFECLNLAYQVLQAGGTTPCILNASNEVAVEKFLQGKIKFSQISEINKRALDEIENHLLPDLETIFECDNVTREFSEKLID